MICPKHATRQQSLTKLFKAKACPSQFCHSHMAAQPNLANTTVHSIEDGQAFCAGVDVRIVNHGSGDVPVLFRNTYAHDHLLVELGHGPTAEKINIQTPGLADVGIVWLGRPNEILLKFVGGTPSVSNKSDTLLPVNMKRKN